MTVITSQMALGDCNDPIQQGHHVDALLCCAAEIPLPRKKPSHHLALHDGLPIDSKLLDAAFRFLDEQLCEKHFVLVYCGHGTSRSASVIAGYVALKSGEELDDVLTRIRRLRPQVAPSAGTFQSIADYVNRRRLGPRESAHE